MIRIDRGKEPEKLARIRAEEITRVAAIEARRPATSKDIGTRYQVVHDVLWKSQYYKCCYCESQEQSKRNDVEHFRPKARAIRSPGSTETHGYWWLAWTWENLLFSCRNCNQSPAKLDKFPLDHGSIPLAAQQQPPGNERPLLIDPATENGCDFIQFVPEYPSSAKTCRWRPVARDGNFRGEKTIVDCGLGRADLLDFYTEHVHLVLRDYVEHIRRAIDADNAPAVRKEWDRATAALLNERQRFVGLARDALDFFIPAAERQRWHLDLPPR